MVDSRLFDRLFAEHAGVGSIMLGSRRRRRERWRSKRAAWVRDIMRELGRHYLTTDKIAYANSANITCTLASLASSATAGRTCTAIDNTGNLYDDALVTLSIKTGAGAPANDKAVYAYIYGSQDGTNFDQEESNAPGTDGAYTINSPTIFKGPEVIPVLTAAKVYTRTFSLAKYWNGVLAAKWGFIVVNFAGQSLDATEGNHIKTYSGVTWTNG